MPALMKLAWSLPPPPEPPPGASRTWMPSPLAMSPTCVTSDWLPMTPEQELKLITDRLKVTGRGIILFHDPRHHTADMMPAFLKWLRDNCNGVDAIHRIQKPQYDTVIQALEQRRRRQ